MGVAITDLLKKKDINLKELKGKILVVDAFNIIYQFLTTIRARDGSPLTNTKGEITSHLIGLFNRTASLLMEGLKLCFVFDGEAPKLKKEERERRKKIKVEAEQQYNAAVIKEDIDEMRKYAVRTSKITKKIIDDSKRLLDLMGVPYIQAPSEGEAQGAYMVKKGDAYAVVTQDADALLFGATRIIRHLGVSPRRKKALIYEKLGPQLILLEETLKELNINLDQLIVIGVLVGTDYNPGGVKKIGPKKALKLVKENKNFEEIFKKVKWEFPFSWKEVFSIFKEIPVTDDYNIIFKKPDEKELIKFLVEENDFNEERVNNVLEKLKRIDFSQKGLNDFF